MSHRVLTIADGRITAEYDPKATTADTVMTSALGLGKE